MRHLTDEQIQLYLDGEVPCDAGIENHLQRCAICQQRLQLYRAVCKGLEEDVGFELAPGFAESVMARLATTPEKETQGSLLNLILGICGTVFTLSLALYFLDIKTLTHGLVSFAAASIRFAELFVASFKIVTTGLGDNVGTILFTILILTVFAILDRILLRYRGGHLCL